MDAVSPSRTERESEIHLAFIRRLRCVYCGRMPPSVAAHVRTMTDGGMGLKPSDRFTVPLCDEHHKHQHQIGEPAFWREVGLEIEDVLTLALSLWDATGSMNRGDLFIRNYRERILDFTLFGL